MFNNDMPGTIPAWFFLLLAVGLWGQASPGNQPEKVAIQHVKNLMASSLDPLLPNVTFEFFLKTAEGSPIRWAVSDCGGRMEKVTANSKPDTPKCVAADIEFKDLRRLVVLVSIGTFKKGVIGIPTVMGVTISGQGGNRPVRGLSDLPMELHRLPPKLPRDVPFPVDAPS